MTARTIRETLLELRDTIPTSHPRREAFVPALQTACFCMELLEKVGEQLGVSADADIKPTLTPPAGDGN